MPDVVTSKQSSFLNFNLMARADTFRTLCENRLNDAEVVAYAVDLFVIDEFDCPMVQWAKSPYRSAVDAGVLVGDGANPSRSHQLQGRCSWHHPPRRLL